MSTRKHRDIGRRYEQLAADFFRQHGFDVLEHNWQAGHKEIDLIVRRQNLIAFVEVKSASTPDFGHPAEWVDKRKVANLAEAAQKYLTDNEIRECDVRFDVVTFTDGRLEHYPNAFEAPTE